MNWYWSLSERKSYIPRSLKCLLRTHFPWILHPATTHPNYSLILHKQCQKMIYKPHSPSPLSYVLIVKLWLYLQAIPRGQEHRQASDCLWALSQKYVPQILLFPEVIWIKWIPFPVAIIPLCFKILCTKRRTLCSKQLLPRVGSPTHVCLALQLPKCLGQRTFQDARATPKEAVGVGFLHSHALISDWSGWR